MRLMKFVWITDIHFSLATLQVACFCFREALRKAQELSVPLVVSGDTNDTKAVLRSEVVRAITTMLEEFADVEVVFLVGNHDLDNERNQNSNCLYFLKAVKNATLVENIMFDENHWGLIPYQNSAEKFRESVQYLKGKVRRIICHQGFFGAKMGSYAVDQTSVSPLEMNDFDIVLTGHYHEHHRVGPKDNIIYGGSPYTVSFAEAGQKKFIHVVTMQAVGATIESIETEARRHVSIKYEQNDHETRMIVKVRPEDLLRIELFGEKAWINKFSKEKMAVVHGTNNISLVPKPIKQNSSRITAQNIFQVAEVVKSYMQTAQTELNKDELMDFFSKELA